MRCIAVLFVCLSAVASGAETIQIRAETCAPCKGTGVMVSFERCPECRRRQQEIYAIREREITAELKAASKDARPRVNRDEVRAHITAEDIESRLPKCIVCDKASRTRTVCGVCGGRGAVYFLPNGTKLAPGAVPDNSKSLAAKQEAETKALRAEIERLEAALTKARQRLAEIDGEQKPASVTPPQRQESPVEFNPRERVPVDIPHEKL